MTRTKGIKSVLSWPNIFNEPLESFNDYESFNQATIDAWGAQRRAFLSSCIKDREWMKDEKPSTGKFYEENVGNAVYDFYNYGGENYFADEDKD